jgi:hypothetical protein
MSDGVKQELNIRERRKKKANVFFPRPVCLRCAAAAPVPATHSSLTVTVQAALSNGKLPHAW